MKAQDGLWEVVSRRETVGDQRRQVILAGELTEEEIVLIAKAEVPAEYAHLDEELKDWRR